MCTPHNLAPGVAVCADSRRNRVSVSILNDCTGIKLHPPPLRVSFASCMVARGYVISARTHILRLWNGFPSDVQYDPEICRFVPLPTTSHANVGEMPRDAGGSRGISRASRELVSTRGNTKPREFACRDNSRKLMGPRATWNSAMFYGVLVITSAME